MLEKEWSAAAGQLERAVAICPDDLQSLVWLGQAYQNAGNCAKALGAYRRALAINPTQADALKGVKACGGSNGGASASKGGGE
jgi:cytochrome c-type biogenesis protein CcmH/NrfG